MKDRRIRVEKVFFPPMSWWWWCASGSRLAEDGLKVAARTPVEADNHNLVEVAVRILAGDADHSPAEDTVVHSLAAVVADRILAVAAAGGGTAVDHSPQRRHTVRVAELRTGLVEVRLGAENPFHPLCHTMNRLHPVAS